ncbi:MAG: phage tail assembly protein [Campylobacteraceae bacterium]|jgi:hypothetical protein|nr:phage tail assembly protein [Campylobacteraceae bacterium]
MIRSKTVKLPINEQEIVFYAPTVGTVRAALENKNEISQGICIIAKCCNMTEKEVEALDYADFAVLSGVLKDFLPSAELA